ncbi:hypothetical protein DFH09DRAFT_1312235 [Mycena vulgaris]|nr:hypothetical protein DFH09DRAFT_1312235 [Mycena vulgaris]
MENDDEPPTPTLRLLPPIRVPRAAGERAPSGIAVAHPAVRLDLSLRDRLLQELAWRWGFPHQVLLAASGSVLPSTTSSSSTSSPSSLKRAESNAEEADARPRPLTHPDTATGRPPPHPAFRAAPQTLRVLTHVRRRSMQCAVARASIRIWGNKGISKQRQREGAGKWQRGEGREIWAGPRVERQGASFAPVSRDGEARGGGDTGEVTTSAAPAHVRARAPHEPEPEAEKGGGRWTSLLSFLLPHFRHSLRAPSSLPSTFFPLAFTPLHPPSRALSSTTSTPPSHSSPLSAFLHSRTSFLRNPPSFATLLPSQPSFLRNPPSFATLLPSQPSFLRNPPSFDPSSPPSGRVWA